MAQAAALSTHGRVFPQSTGPLPAVNTGAFGPVRLDGKNDCLSSTISASAISLVLYTAVTFIWSITDSLRMNKHLTRHGVGGTQDFECSCN